MKKNLINDKLDDLTDFESEKVFTEIAIIYRKVKKYESAEKILWKALDIDATALPILNELGRLYVKLGNFEQAESLFLKALEKNIGNDSYFLTSLIKLYSKTKNHKKADELIKKYTNKTTVFYDFFCKYCYIYIKNEKGLKDAIKYKKYIQNYNKKFNI